MAEQKRIKKALTKFAGTRKFDILAGTASGILIILIAVLISAMAFGAYGLGLFVLTPIVVGFATGYLVNRRELLTMKETNRFVLLSAGLGCLALILFALEGLVCLILAAPLGAVAAIGGGALGRRLARSAKDSAGPLYCVALLPVFFAIDAVYPPAVIMQTDESIVIAAPPSQVWQALISEESIDQPVTIFGRMGLAYPVRARFSGFGVGKTRTGYFSTGAAQERITDWEENRVLGFRVLSQPPAMKETSPYGNIHTPHLDGYFETGETRFELKPVGTGATKLTVKAAHRLSIDPVIYWQPIAKWAIGNNTRRVLLDLKNKAERNSHAI